MSFLLLRPGQSTRSCSIRCGREITSVERGHEKEELSFAVWATALFDDIAQRNYVNHDSMVALRHLIEHDRVD